MQQAVLTLEKKLLKKPSVFLRKFLQVPIGASIISRVRHKPDMGERRVLRGGTWYRDVHTLRSAERISDYPENSLNVVGFRCAMDVP